VTSSCSKALSSHWRAERPERQRNGLYVKKNPRCRAVQRAALTEAAKSHVKLPVKSMLCGRFSEGNGRSRSCSGLANLRQRRHRPAPTVIIRDCNRPVVVCRPCFRLWC
jgi:hypothetical protein